MSADQKKLSYEDAGYNRFFRRTIASNPTETTLSNVGKNRSFQNQELKFDQRQTSGSLGDIVRVGESIELNGPAERISLRDKERQEVIRLGNGED